MDVSHLISTYGYWAVAAGTFFEGETVLLGAAAAAAHEYLRMPAVVVVAAFCGFLGDQFFFFLGRRCGQRLLARFPSIRARTTKVTALIERHDTLLILAVRFMYGLRTAGPVAIGMSAVHWWRFLLLNLAGAAIWSVTIASIGYGLALGFDSLAQAFGGFTTPQAWLLGAATFTAFVGWYVARHGYRSHAKHK